MPSVPRIHPLPDLGLPKLANDSTVLSYLPAAMQHVYSIRFNRNKGKLQVKSAQLCPGPDADCSQTLDVGNPAGMEGQRGRDGGRERSLLMTILRAPLCKAFIMSMVAIATVIVTIVILIINKSKPKYFGFYMYARACVQWSNMNIAHSSIFLMLCTVYAQLAYAL